MKQVLSERDQQVVEKGERKQKEREWEKGYADALKARVAREEEMEKEKRYQRYLVNIEIIPDKCKRQECVIKTSRT